MNAEELGRTVRSRRKELRIDRKTLAELAGVAIHTVVNLETAKANPTLQVLSRVLNALGLELTVKPRTTER